MSIFLITIKTFRKTINQSRKEICFLLEDRKLLLGHKVSDVNIAKYINHDIESQQESERFYNSFRELEL